MNKINIQEKHWQTIIDFTKIQDGGIEINDLLSRFDNQNKRSVSSRRPVCRQIEEATIATYK